MQANCSCTNTCLNLARSEANSRAVAGLHFDYRGFVASLGIRNDTCVTVRTTVARNPTDLQTFLKGNSTERRISRKALFVFLFVTFPPYYRIGSFIFMFASDHEWNFS